MALARLDLAARSVRRRLAVLGPALVLLGYGTSWLVLKALGHSIPGPMVDGMPSKDAMADMAAGSGPPPADGFFPPDPWSLLAAEPHSGSTFDVIGCLGVAITVILCATVAMDRLPRLRRLAKPVIAVGTMSLTIYVTHILAILALPGDNATPPDANSTLLWCAFVLAAVVFAALWARVFRRGPLEYLLNSTTRLARHVR